MKRAAFIRELRAAGCTLKRHGRRHDIYTHPATGRTATVPRHTELADTLCQSIKKQLGLQ